MARTRQEWEGHQRRAEIWQGLRRIIALGFIACIMAAAFFVFREWLAWAIAAVLPFLIGFLGTYFGGKRGATGYTEVLVGLMTLAACAMAAWGHLIVAFVPFWLTACALGMLMGRSVVDPVDSKW
ncbi:MAG: hypothetical protein ABL962_08990 [Fimbriimonadaceae bacterium]